MHETDSPYSQEGIKALQCVSACVKKIRRIKKKIKDLTSSVLASKENSLWWFVEVVAVPSTATRMSKGACTKTQALGMSGAG